jgi:hypothetical protein
MNVDGYIVLPDFLELAEFSFLFHDIGLLLQQEAKNAVPIMNGLCEIPGEKYIHPSCGDMKRSQLELSTTKKGLETQKTLHKLIGDRLSALFPKLFDGRQNFSVLISKPGATVQPVHSDIEKRYVKECEKQLKVDLRIRNMKSSSINNTPPVSILYTLMEHTHLNMYRMAHILDVDQSELVKMVLDRNSLVIFRCDALHSGGPNPTDDSNWRISGQVFLPGQPNIDNALKTLEIVDQIAAADLGIDLGPFEGLGDEYWRGKPNEDDLESLEVYSKIWEADRKEGRNCEDSEDEDT